MAESLYLQQEMEHHPEALEYLSDLRILRRFVQSGSFGFKQSDDVIFQRLKTRYPRAYSAFGEERRRETLQKYQRSPYIEGQKSTYPDNPDKEGYVEALESLRHIMILFGLCYGSREMAMARVNSARRFPEACEAFERELEDLLVFRKGWADCPRHHPLAKVPRP
jgi:hypothetical protein